MYSSDVLELVDSLGELLRESFFVNVRDLADFMDSPVLAVESLLRDASELGLVTSSPGGTRFFKLTAKGVSVHEC
jgi:hypothetical protein